SVRSTIHLSRRSWSKKGAPVAGRASSSAGFGRARARPIRSALLEVAGELHVPVARHARLTFQGRLAKARQVELVGEVLLVGRVVQTHGRVPGVLRAVPFEAHVQQLVTLGAEVLLGDVVGGAGQVGLQPRADLALAVVVDARRELAAITHAEVIAHAEAPVV